MNWPKLRAEFEKRKDGPKRLLEVKVVDGAMQDHTIILQGQNGQPATRTFHTGMAGHLEEIGEEELVIRNQAGTVTVFNLADVRRVTFPPMIDPANAGMLERIDKQGRKAK